MSRYMVNKLLWEIDQFDQSLDAFRADPQAYVDDWERAAGSPSPPYPRGGSLTDEERAAVTGLDFGALYGMGVNPFLLWQFARSVAVPDLMSVEELVGSFRTAVEPHGHPDFFT